MEPRPHERGKIALRRGLPITQTTLQWSHVLTNVERSAPGVEPEPSARRFNGATSSRTWKEIQL